MFTVEDLRKVIDVCEEKDKSLKDHGARRRLAGFRNRLIAAVESMESGGQDLLSRADVRSAYDNATEECRKRFKAALDARSTPVSV
jgi:hypothetical protein